MDKSDITIVENVFDKKYYEEKYKRLFESDVDILDDMSHDLEYIKCVFRKYKDELTEEQINSYNDCLYFFFFIIIEYAIKLKKETDELLEGAKNESNS